MDQSIETIVKTREVLLKAIEGLSVEELNIIPENFNNNIAWNLGHVLASQQILCYKLTGNDMKLAGEYIEKYKKGTKPECPISAEEIALLKQQAITLMDETQKDLDADRFVNFTAYPTSFGVHLSDIQGSLKYVAMHEGLHLGYVMALKRVIKK